MVFGCHWSTDAPAQAVWVVNIRSAGCYWAPSSVCIMLSMFSSSHSSRTGAPPLTDSLAVQSVFMHLALFGHITCHWSLDRMSLDSGMNSQYFLPKCHELCGWKTRCAGRLVLAHGNSLPRPLFSPTVPRGPDVGVPPILPGQRAVRQGGRSTKTRCLGRETGEPGKTFVCDMLQPVRRNPQRSSQLEMSQRGARACEE